MPFNTLFNAGYRAFVEEQRDRSDLWFFLHIPKTAGSSFRAELSTILTPDYNIHAYDEAAAGKDHLERLQASIRSFVTASWTTRYRFVSGHVPVSMMAPLNDTPSPPKTFTILRDPVARFISDYRYQSTSEHPDNAAFRARYPSIQAYLAERGECDKITRFLAPAPDASVQETLDHVFGTFAFVGSMETYDTSFRIMMDLLGVDRAPSVFLRKTSAGEAIAVEQTPALEDAIRAANARDVELYEAFMARLRRVDEIVLGGGDVGHAAEKLSRWRDIG